ncbi:sulfotransferase [Marivita sp. XM-24bin2]|uniref:sulfotransferase n=1 Tax=Marivita sp. XM-24bin2 TaxID=2133951 RepID=UPI000D7AB5F5|nr:sulfotransferase [Marivita sp. XM-24bin2]PWL33440.1 MAG: hypothetical protein DCO97_19610 [Marivita sp. XM-24bin2]
MSAAPKILFLSEASLFDCKSGAAQSVRAMLRSLADAGWTARSVTMTLCDGEAEQPLAALHPDLTADLAAGDTARVLDHGVTHELLVARSSRHAALRPWEMRRYLELARERLVELAPDIVLTYSSDALRPLLLEAQQRGARTAFYVANPGYAQREGFAFRFVDAFLMPSHAMVDLYKGKLGIEGRVLRHRVEPPFAGAQNRDPARIAKRGERYVTMINPDPAKGGLFFLNLAAQVKSMAPEIRFRAVESRWGRSNWEELQVPPEHLDAIDWHPSTSDMSKVYSEAALLVTPSLWFEAAGRVIPEAQLSGVPVLATRSGGIPEQVGEGGFLFDVPEGMAENYFATPPTDAVQHWAKFVTVLMRDDGIYARAVDLALKASQEHAPEVRAGQIVGAFEEILNRLVLDSIGTDPAVQEHLAALREKMNALRADVNARLDSEPLASVGSDDTPEDEPYAEVLKRSLAQPAVRDALTAAKAGDHDRVRAILEQYLRLMPEDIVALGILADTADKQEREGEARRLMERVVELAPGFVAGHQQLVRYLRHAGDAEAALRHSFALLERAPNQPRYLALHANLLTNANRFDEAIAVYEGFFGNHKGVAQDWMQYALALKTVGRQEDAVAAYREAIARAPGNGAAWHALSNMKLAVFTDDDIAVMEEQLRREDLAEEDRYNIHFTLGKAYEDRKAYAPSFENYTQANSIRRAQSEYDIGRLEDYVAQAKEVFTPEFFETRKGFGTPEADPIFIVGLHRAGSTLTEQILSSHSQIEGTRELPDLLRIGRDFGGLAPGGQETGLNTGLLADLDGDECAALGRRFLESTRGERRTDRPYFIDKMPANWMYAGLIHLILPNAKIIDIRRQPMAAGFALFKMNFGRGVDHSYDQKDIARYYRAYADLMAHFDVVLPGRIHHLQYEALVDETEAEIRRMIDYCGLPFEEHCLRYWETERAVQTPSSEQVRKPIFKDAVEQWRNYADWLGPMEEVFADMPTGEPTATARERA